MRAKPSRIIRTHAKPDDFVMEPGEIDLFDHVTFFLLRHEGHLLAWRIYWTSQGWRAQQNPKGRQRRALVGPGWSNPTACLDWLIRTNRICWADLLH